MGVGARAGFGRGIFYPAHKTTTRVSPHWRNAKGLRASCTPPVKPACLSRGLRRLQRSGCATKGDGAFTGGD